MPDTLPSAFLDGMRALLGNEADAFFAALDRSPLTGLRTNLLKLRPEHIERIVPFDLQPLPWCAAGFVVGSDERPGKHPYHAAGLYYLQEPSAMAVVEALQVQPGQRVLDLAAAPGGKTTQIAALLQGEGVLVSNEIEAGRIKPLGENLERWGARNVILTNESPERLADHFGASFERVLLDAPCSGEGMFRKNPIARSEWSVEHVMGCAIRQARILQQAARLVAPGGLLVYSTCTFAPEENEGRVAQFLAEHDGWELVDLPKRHGFAPARPDWVDPPLPQLTRAVRLWPHKLQGEGHFIALLRRTTKTSGDRSDPWPERGWRLLPRKRDRHAPTADPAMPPRDAIAAWQAWERATLTTTFPLDRLIQRNDQLYLTPADRPDLGSLRVVRPGLWLGTIKPGRFEPSHALALALLPDDAQRTIDRRADSVDQYLRGETWRDDGSDGWVLIRVDGWPLGWARRVGGVVKNFYPKGLRWPS